MKKTLLLLITTIIAINIVHAQIDWVSYKIDSRLSVKLPTEPQRKDENSMMATVKDSSVYFITIIDMGTDTIKASEMLNKPNFANGLKDAMMDREPGFTIGEMKKSNWKGYTTFRAEGDNAATHMKLYFGSRLYFLGNIIPEGKVSKIDLFDLLTLN